MNRASAKSAKTIVQYTTAALALAGVAALLFALPKTYIHDVKLDSPIDTTNWPTVTHPLLGFSIQYPPASRPVVEAMHEVPPSDGDNIYVNLPDRKSDDGFFIEEWESCNKYYGTDRWPLQRNVVREWREMGAKDSSLLRARLSSGQTVFGIVVNGADGLPNCPMYRSIHGDGPYYVWYTDRVAHWYPAASAYAEAMMSTLRIID